MRDARRRRRLPAAVLAERASISLPTLRKIERGDPAVALGTYGAVLFALGLADRLPHLADARTDAVGLALEEERLPRRVSLRRPVRPVRPVPLSRADGATTDGGRGETGAEP